ncbi:methionyl-tRNA formyltransferase [candidate division WOR-3 bacterium]|nr:methionyl-tRNA formyltransferase [candidate division WOR-3 bacterium]
MNIVFFGSDSFGIPALERLNSISNLLIITEHDKPAGRGRKIFPLPPKIYALKNNINFLETNNCNEDTIIEKINNFKPDFFVVASFGQLLKEVILSLPKYLPLNIHPSLLPKYRGAAPIRRAIMNGENETGISIIKMDKKLDAGSIILQKRIRIDDDTIYTDLFKTLSISGAELLLKAIYSIIKDNYKMKIQDDSCATYAEKITRTDYTLNANRDSKSVLRQINAFSERPGTRFKLGGQYFKIIRATYSNVSLPRNTIGAIKKHLYLGTKTNSLEILKIQPSGKSVMDSKAFLNGYRIDHNIKLEEE